MMPEHKHKEDGEIVRNIIRLNYAKIAKTGIASCGCSTAACCASGRESAKDIAIQLGYSANDVVLAPDGANMGLGCGNPHAIALLKPGETILDLGSGGGFDCFLAARAVGENGRVIGVDMTPEMVQKARENAQKAGITNVEFRLGEIENLPVADGTIDVIISNCVINLSPEKHKAFDEAFRVLKPGGRLAISDIVAMQPLPDEIRNDLVLLSSCIAGASPISYVEDALRAAGFVKIKITPDERSKDFIRNWAPGMRIEEYVVSAAIEALKPLGK